MFYNLTFPEPDIIIRLLVLEVPQRESSYNSAEKPSHAPLF